MTVIEWDIVPTIVVAALIISWLDRAVVFYFRKGVARAEDYVERRTSAEERWNDYVKRGLDYDRN